MESLSQYLAKYVQTELDRRYENSGANGQWTQGDLEEWLYKGIKSCESIVNCKVVIVYEDSIKEDIKEHEPLCPHNPEIIQDGQCGKCECSND